MARQKTVCISKENLSDFSLELLNALNESYRVVCISDTPIDDKPIKTTQKKPTAFATLRRNSVLFEGDVEKCKLLLTKTKGDKIAFDFDGVINSYVSGWTGIDLVVDEPVKGIIDFIKDCQKTYKEVAIFSSRCCSSLGIETIDNYLKKYGVNINTYLNEIDDTYILVDDRAIDYTKVNDIVAYLSTFDSWVKKAK